MIKTTGHLCNRQRSRPGIVNDLREDFLDLCDDMNLNTSIEAPGL